MKQFSPAAAAEAAAFLKEYPNKQSALLMVLRIAEREFGCIDDEAISLVAKTCESNEAHVLGMVTFYTHFKRPYHGRHRLMVCATLMCDIAGSDVVLRRVHERLGIKAGERTEDGLFSVEKVECLADCDRPTAVQVDNSHYVHVTPERVDEIINELLKKENKDASYKSKPVKMDSTVAFIPVKRSVG